MLFEDDEINSDFTFSNGVMLRGQFRDDYGDLPFVEGTVPLILCIVEDAKEVVQNLTVPVTDLSGNSVTYNVQNVQRQANGIASIILKAE